MGDVNLEIKLSNLDERVIKIEETGGGSGGDDYITSVSNDFNVVNKKLSLSNDVTTKLPKSVPTTSDAGKVAKVQSDGTVDWETPSASITEPTDLEKGIIGGDEWVSGGSYTIGESVVIDENKLYLLVGDGGSTTKPSTDVTHSIWEETSISTLNSKLATKVIATANDNSNSYQLFKSANVYTLNIQGCTVRYDTTIQRYILSNLDNTLILYNVVPKNPVTNLLFDNTNNKIMLLTIESSGYGVVYNIDGKKPIGNELVYGQISWILE